MARDNFYLEAYKNLNDYKKKIAEKNENAIQEAANQNRQFKKDYRSIMESREVRMRRHGKLLEACRDDALKTAIKGIFIGALEAHTLTDSGLILAETMVDNWIAEKGGASKVLGECKDRTYLLNRIAQIVEEAAMLETEEIEKIESDEEEIEVENDDKKEEEDDPSDSEVKDAMETLKDKIGDDEEAKKALETLKNKVDVEEEDDDSEEKSEESESEEEKKEEETPEESTPEKSEEENSDDEGEDDVDPEDELDLEDNSEEPAEDEPTEGGAKEESEGDATGAEETTPTGDAEPEDNSEEPKGEEEEAPTEDPGSEEVSGEEVPANDPEESEDAKDVEVPDDATDPSDDSESDVADDITDDLEEVPEKDLSVDGGDSEISNGKVLDDLDKEEDVQKAVELIRQRVADAEENFIKRNAEDKKQVEELIGRISDNVKTVEDISDENNPQQKIAAESARMNKRKISSITENRPLSIFEKFTRIIHGNIIKDQSVKESYVAEDGTIDTGLIVETAKIMYGFLETLNTLQLEKVDEKYIENLFKEMK